MQQEGSLERFKRLAEARVTKTIRDVRLIGNLSNRNNYSYRPEDVDKIFKTLEKELKSARAKFDGRPVDDDTKFTL